jgi:hypothetical protein
VLRGVTDGKSPNSVNRDYRGAPNSLYDTTVLIVNPCLFANAFSVQVGGCSMTDRAFQGNEHELGQIVTAVATA